MNKKKNIIKKCLLFLAFLMIYTIYFMYCYDDSIESNISSTYYLIVGSSIGVAFIIPIYIYLLINETKNFFSINMLTRFKSYDKWLNKVVINTAFYTVAFILILNTAYILSVFISGKYSIDINSIIYILKTAIIQCLTLISIGIIIQFFSFLWENKYIGFSITYGFILIQYGAIRWFRLPKSLTIVDMIFFDAGLLSSGDLIRKLVISTVVVIFIYFQINLLITKKDVLWSNNNEKV